MKQEDKELLLRDLSARLPYGVYCKIDGCSEPVKLVGIKTYDEWRYKFGVVWEDIDTNNIVPYLRPMSSVTAGEAIELCHITGKCEVYPMAERGFRLTDLMSDFCNKHHLDYRGLIPKGIALVAKEGMYKFE